MGGGTKIYVDGTEQKYKNVYLKQVPGFSYQGTLTGIDFTEAVPFYDNNDGCVHLVYSGYRSSYHYRLNKTSNGYSLTQLTAPPSGIQDSLNAFTNGNNVYYGDYKWNGSAWTKISNNITIPAYCVICCDGNYLSAIYSEDYSFKIYRYTFSTDTGTTFTIFSDKTYDGNDRNTHHIAGPSENSVGVILPEGGNQGNLGYYCLLKPSSYSFVGELGTPPQELGWYSSTSLVFMYRSYWVSANVGIFGEYGSWYEARRPYYINNRYAGYYNFGELATYNPDRTESIEPNCACAIGNTGKTLFLDTHRTAAGIYEWPATVITTE